MILASAKPNAIGSLWIRNLGRKETIMDEDPNKTSPLSHRSIHPFFHPYRRFLPPVSDAILGIQNREDY
jgi:hypothetical protein